MVNFYNYNCTKFKWHKVNDLYMVDDKFRITFDDGKFRYIITILPGFMTDGGSIPKVFQWFAKGWTDDYRYNAIFILHDAMYCTEYVHREIADDMLRSCLREYGMTRFQASTIHFCVRNFAKRHYGIVNDENDNFDFVQFSCYKL